MAMNVGNVGARDPEVMIDINTTPLIDVMLVLIIMLIITIPIQTHAVKLDLPQANAPPPPTTVQPEVVDLEIDFDGTPIWNGTPVPSRAQLDRFFQDTANKIPQPEVHIRGDQDVRYESMGRVVVACQRAGIAKVGFITEPPPNQ